MPKTNRSAFHPGFVTTGDIARKIGCPLSRVTYAIRVLVIQEDGRAGHIRPYASYRIYEIIRRIKTVGKWPTPKADRGRACEQTCE